MKEILSRISTEYWIKTKVSFTIQLIYISASIFFISSSPSNAQINGFEIDSAFANYLYELEKYELAEQVYLKLMQKDSSAYFAYFTLRSQVKQRKIQINKLLSPKYLKYSEEYDDYFQLYTIISSYINLTCTDSVSSEYGILINNLIKVNQEEHPVYLEVIDSSNTFLTSLNDSLIDLYSKKIKISRKRPWKAAVLSGVIPGLGKVYAGKPKEGISSFISILTSTAIAFEGYNRNEFQSIPFYIFGAYALTNYFSGIFGSYYSIKTIQNDFKYYFNVEATEIYYSILNDFISKN